MLWAVETPVWGLMPSGKSALIASVCHRLVLFLLPFLTFPFLLCVLLLLFFHLLIWIQAPAARLCLSSGVLGLPLPLALSLLGTLCGVSFKTCESDLSGGLSLSICKKLKSQRTGSRRRNLGWA